MKSSEDGLLRLIAIFKFLKAALLIALGIGLFKLLHKDIGSVLERWCEALRLDPGSHFVNLVLEAFCMQDCSWRKAPVYGCESAGGSG